MMAQQREFHVAQAQWKKRVPRVSVRRSSVPDGRTWLPSAWHLLSLPDKPGFHNYSAQPDAHRYGIRPNQPHSRSHPESIVHKARRFPYFDCNDMTCAIAFVKVQLSDNPLGKKVLPLTAAIRVLLLVSAVATGAFCMGAAASDLNLQSRISALVTEDFTVASDTPGIQLYVRNKRPPQSMAKTRVLLYVHGATYPASTAFDLAL